MSFNLQHQLTSFAIKRLKASFWEHQVTTGDQFSMATFFSQVSKPSRKEHPNIYSINSAATPGLQAKHVFQLLEKFWYLWPSNQPTIKMKRWVKNSKSSSFNLVGFSFPMICYFNCLFVSPKVHGCHACPTWRITPLTLLAANAIAHIMSHRTDLERCFWCWCFFCDYQLTGSLRRRSLSSIYIIYE